MLKLNQLKLLKQIRKIDKSLTKEYFKRNLFRTLIPRYNYNNHIITLLEAEKRHLQRQLEKLIA